MSKLDELEFVECDTCIMKSGSSRLCRGCFMNRVTIGKLKLGKLEEREAMKKMVEGKKQHIFYPLGEKSSNMNEAYNKALSDILNELNKN